MDHLKFLLSNQTISLGHGYSTDNPGHNKLYSIQSCIAHYSDPVRKISN